MSFRGRQAVGISWYRTQIRTVYQEIATPYGLAMTEEDDSWFF